MAWGWRCPAGRPPSAASPAISPISLTLSGRAWTQPPGVLLSLLILAVGAVSGALLQYFVVFAIGGLAFPFVSFSGAGPSYGGPPAP